MLTSLERRQRRLRPHRPCSDIDASPGDYFLFPEDDETEFWQFAGPKTDGTLKFVSEKTGKPRAHSPREFNLLRGQGRAVLLDVDQRNGLPTVSLEVHPGAIGDDWERLPERTRKSLEAKRRLFLRRRIVRQYVILIDETEFPSRTVDGLSRFIKEHSCEVDTYGLDWQPSATTVGEAARLCGTPGNRPLTAFLRPRPKSPASKNPSPLWHRATLTLKASMVEMYWSSGKVRHCDAIAWFYDEFREEARRLEAKGEKSLTRPSKSTLRNWINEAGTRENWARRHGKKKADARFRGRGTSIQATRVLEYVMIDHTLIDVWAKVVDSSGATILVARPVLTLAIDVYSRAILAAVLSFDPPSLNSVMLCIQQIVCPKDWLITQYGHHKGATDVWGRPRNVIVDNGMEFVSPSFQSTLEAAGIDVIWAPVKRPEYKSPCERMFKTLNDLVWHRLPGAITATARERAELGLEIDPPAEAEFTIEELSDRLWRAIVTVYHMEEHDGIGMAPARAWTLGIEKKGRHTVNDVRTLFKHFGRVHAGKLTRDGVEVDCMRFTDPARVTGLLDRLLPKARARDQRKGKLASGKVTLPVTVHPWTCEYIHVWDEQLKKSIKLVNVDSRFAKGQTWFMACLCLAYAKRMNLAHQSDDEKYAARAALMKTYTSADAPPKRRDSRTAARVHVPSKPRFVPGKTIEEVEAEPSFNGMTGYSVPMGIAASERTSGRLPRRAPRRGGKSATEKSKQSRARRAASNSDEASSTNVDFGGLSAAIESQHISLPPGNDNYSDLLDQLETQLEWKK